MIVGEAEAVPLGSATRQRERAKAIGARKSIERETGESGASRDLGDAAIPIAARRDQLVGLGFAQPLHAAQSEAQSERRIGRRLDWLQGAVPETEIDIGRANLDAVFACIAHDLRRRIKTHGLTVDQSRGEDCGVDAFDPCRDIDEMREARRMALRKAIGSEALDLLEAAHREILRIAVPQHAADEFRFEAMDVAGLSECRHRTAQTVRLGGLESGGDDGDAHRLLLEERYPQRLAEDDRELR